MVSKQQMDAAAFITVEHNDFVSMAKIVAKRVNPLLNTVTLDLVPYHDTIHPYPLTFDPPLIEHASADGRARV